jgi:outer membrane immunogenic protein
MKRCIALTVVFFASIALAQIASAGQEPMGKEMAPVPVPPPCDWTGLYIGLNVGVGQLDSTFTDRNDWEDYASREFSKTAFVGGGQIGYNYQWKDLVMGIEADFSGSTANIKKDSLSAEAAEETSEGYGPEGYTDHSKIDFMGTIRGRLGISFNNNRALLYGTAGGAYAHGTWDTYYHYEHLYYGNYYEADWRSDDWRWGWVGGFGFEYALDCHWSVRGEALYYWFGDKTATNSLEGSYYVPANNYKYDYTFSDSFWSYRVGVNYKFTGFFGAH